MKQGMLQRLVLGVTLIAFSRVCEANAPFVPYPEAPGVMFPTAATIMRQYAPPNPNALVPHPGSGIGGSSFSPNLYGYVGGNPISFRDPQGMARDGAIIGGAIGGSVGGAVGAVVGGGGATLVCSPTGALALACTVPGAGQGALVGGGIGTSAGAVVGSLVEDICKMMSAKSKEDMCYEQCEHLHPSPTGDLQGSDFSKCWRECMGRL